MVLGIGIQDLESWALGLGDLGIWGLRFRAQGVGVRLRVRSVLCRV